MGASEVAHRGRGALVQISPSARYLLVAGFLCLGTAALVLIDLVLLPRYLATSTPTFSAAPVSPSPIPVSDSPAPIRPVTVRSLPPAAPPASSAEPDVAPELPHLLFANAAAWLSPAARRILAAAATFLVKHPDRRVVLNGYADTHGLPARNRDLSNARARQAQDWLVHHGVDPSRIETHGFGSSRPITTDPSPRSQAKNRRVEIVLQ